MKMIALNTVHYQTKPGGPIQIAKRGDTFTVPDDIGNRLIAGRSAAEAPTTPEDKAAAEAAAQAAEKEAAAQAAEKEAAAQAADSETDGHELI